MNKQYIYAAKYLNLMRKILFFLIVSFIGTIKVLSVSAQNKSDEVWVKGYYYNKNGNKISGFINVYSSDKNIRNYRRYHIWFKSTEQDVNYHKISADSIKAYIVLADSFVVSHSPGLRRPFLKVIADEPVKLYKSEIIVEPSMSTMGPYGSTVQIVSIGRSYKNTIYYYGSNPDNLTQLRKAHFLSEMAEIFGSVPSLVDDIKYQNFTYNDMDQILSYYERYKHKSE